MEAIPIPLAPHDVDMNPFKYIATSFVHNRAYIHTSIIGLGKREFCACGREDCLAGKVHCECTKETNGEFAYNPNGLLKDKFMLQSKNLNRTFIKECNVRCGCHNKCSNRVIQ